MGCSNTKVGGVVLPTCLGRVGGHGADFCLQTWVSNTGEKNTTLDGAVTHANKLFFFFFLKKSLYHLEPRLLLICVAWPGKGPLF